MKLNGGRCVSGVLRGFDPYMNLVLDECVEEKSAAQKNKIGMVVSLHAISPNWMYAVNVEHVYMYGPFLLKISSTVQ